MSLIKPPGSENVVGDLVQMRRTSPRHFDKNGNMGIAPLENGGFGDMVSKALNGANDAEMNSSNLMQQMITDPESVNVHDVTIAMAKAEMAVNLTKSVIDGAVKAYKDIISTR